MLRVTVQKAANLPDVDFRGKSDPYAKLSFQGVQHKTEHIKDELNPEWNKSFEWDLNGKPLNPDEKLTVVIKDYEKIGFNKVLGKCDVPLRDLVRGKQKQIQQSYALKDGKDNPIAATCDLQITYEPPAGAQDDSGGGGGDGDEEDGEEAGGEGEETEADEEGGEEGEEAGGEPGKPGRPRRKRKRKSRKGRRRWSDKVQDFQIRVKVIEGRQLPGNNIHPLVRITMSNQKRETQACRSTNKPVYNESFVFNFHTSEAELFDELFVVEAFNSKKLRSDALLGYFESDIGSIYEMKGHSFVRKWVLLTGPGSEGGDDDEEEGEEGGKSKSNKSSLGGAAAGYIKITAMVLGPGDEPPAKAKHPPKDIEEDDIESNCLMPMGVSRQPAVFSVKIYQAEDIPQMDTGMGRSIKKFFKGLFGGGKEEEEKGAKGLVDPYVKLSFCGKKVDTSIKYQDDAPEFKEMLQLPLMFPSMCERVKLQLYDWDRVGNDDCIGTACLSLSAMSGEGDEGFPPTFGPCFVNFYGSPREFSELPDQNEDLNKGIGEGVAYRGRALVELETTLGSDDIDNEVTALETDDCIRVQPFLRREKYKLFACFYDATMVKDVDGPVEFEVSIGNYGNKMDESVAPANTAPSNPVYDGCHYHYLPWGNEKPVVCVESFWEDIAFRLEPLNLLTSLCERLQKPLNQIKKALDAPTPPDDKAFVAMVTSVLDHLVSNCMKEQDRFENEILRLPGHRNRLDNKIESLRTEELKLISIEATELKHQIDPPPPPPPPVQQQPGEAPVEPAPPVEIEEIEIDRDAIVGELEGFLQRLQDLAIEPQNSMPDVIIWMISGSDRIAYYRIPAYQVMHFSNPEARGPLCGCPVELKLKYPGKKGGDIKEHPEIPALVRVELWLGLEKDQDDWTARGKSEGEFVVYAESYENEMKIGPKWFKKGCPRPGFSSADGELELPLEKFVEPPGWNFLGDWEKKPELSIMFDKDAGRKIFIEEIYEQQDRNFPGGEWKQAKVPWTDVSGDDCDSKENVQIPAGWQWVTQWQVDANRAVDGEGWEYTVDISYGVYSPVQKAYYLSRRRRWVRRRDLKNPESSKKQEHFQKLLVEGWEYAPIFTMKFHAKERKMDFVRRRRLMRKLVPQGGGKLDPKKTKLPPLLRVQLKSKDAESALILSPRMFVSFDRPHKFQLWAYVYQARDLIASDDSGMNDPFVRVAFANQSQVTETKMKTLCPTWDQTLIFDVEIYDSLENIQRHPPSVIMELFDKDQMGKDDFLGRTEFKPLPKMNGIEGPPCKLLWHSITRGDDDDCGEILAACELFLDEGAQLPIPPTARDATGEILPVRDRVRPVLQKTVVEVLCWGVRNMKKYQLASVKNPSVQFEIGGEIIQSDILSDAKKFPNFGRPILPRKILNLPVEEMYTPPMNIRIHDNRTFGRKPTVAVHSIKALNRFRVKAPPPPSALQIEVEAPKGQQPLRSAPPGQSPQLTSTDGQLVPVPPPPSQGEGSGVGEGAGGEGQGPLPRTSSQTIPPSPGPAKRDPSKVPQAKPKRGPKKTPEERAKEAAIKFDWWSKYHASLAGESESTHSGHGKAKKLLALLSPDEADSSSHIDKYRERGYDQLTVYPKELERVEKFGGFQDVIASFPLFRGKKKKRKSDDDEEQQKVVGEFKGSFRIYPMPEYDGGEAELPETLFTNLPQTEPINCLVRVYIISATDLQPQDPSGLADPYVVVQLGKKKVDTKDNYKPNTLNPIFGKMFEFDAVIPQQKDLKIIVMDYDLLSRDDMIGETTIDLEQRLLSRYHAKCGLPKTYCDSGPNKWRDHKKPMELLKEWCDRNDKNFKFYKGTKDGTPDRIVVAYRVYQLDEFEDFEEENKPNDDLGVKHQRLALHVLNELEMVPEHIETRALKSNVQPNIEQGKIQLWVDLFPRDVGGVLKPSVDVTAREPQDYSLRVIVWNTADVIMEETSITGEQMSDIYVKAWMDREDDDKQKTDVHYRSMDGDGNFNWRMVFPFLYLPIEKKMVIRKKEHFWSLDYKEERTIPRLMVQIWENDTFSYDDFLGKLELDLIKLPKPCSSPGRCGGSRDPGKNGEFVDLFQQKAIQGWWACYQEGNEEPTGKVEMTLELLNANEAAAKPVGMGRDEPNQHPHLDEPNRPATSFLWFTSPFKTLKHIIWKNYKWYIIGFLVLLLIIAIVVIFVYSLPGYTAKKILNV